MISQIQCFGAVPSSWIERALERKNNGAVAWLDSRIADLGQEILQRNRVRQDYDQPGLCYSDHFLDMFPRP